MLAGEIEELLTAGDVAGALAGHETDPAHGPIVQWLLLKSQAGGLQLQRSGVDAGDHLLLHELADPLVHLGVGDLLGGELGGCAARRVPRRGPRMNGPKSSWAPLDMLTSPGMLEAVSVC